MNKRSISRSLWLPLAATCALGLAACSDDDPGFDAGTPDGGTVETDGGGTTTDGGGTTDPDGGTTDPDSGVMPTACDNPPLTAPANGTCAVTAGTGGATLLRGDVLSAMGLLENGHVLVGADGKITCAQCDCSQAPGFAEATVIECAEGVISPALINLHDHITFTETPPTPPPDVNERYDHRHDWRRGLDEHTRIPSVRNEGGDNGVWWGELRNLMAGATSINGSGAADGLLRNLDRSGNQLEGLEQGAIFYSTFPLGDSDGRKRSTGCGYESFDSATEGRFTSAIAYTPHIAEGIELEARNEFLCLSSDANGGSDVITEKTAVIHGVGLLPPDWAAMAADGSALIWSARTNLSLYGVTADVITARNSGVNIALGTDWTASGSMNMLRELRCVDEYNQRNLGGFFSDRELWLMATEAAAAAVHSTENIGVIATGRFADVTIFAKSGSQSYRAVLDAEPEDVVLVMRGGEPLYGDADVMTSLGAITGCETLDVCGVSKAVCSEAETGATIAQHRSRIANDAYDLFFCDTPPMEPSCIPYRGGEFMGVGSDTDTDGDGVTDDLDNCPTVFNPIRPMDNGVQADFDSDMVGDACDACPLAEGTTGCEPPDPNDLDGDGWPNTMDNCPGIANEDQADADMDDIGDVCDECPNESNAGGAACSRTIYEVKQGKLTARVGLRNVIVTAAGDLGYFVAHAPGDDAYDATLGPDYSGIFVYTGSAGDKPARGDRIDVDGDASDYFGQHQLSNGTFTVLSSDNALPEPILVSPADVATEEPRGARLEGVLIEVQSVTVNEVNPAAGPGDSDPTNEFVVDGGLNVNDYMYRLDPLPAVGETLSFVRGVLRYANNDYKLEPRDELDVGAEAALFGFDPATSAVPAGTNGVPADGLQVRLTRPALADTEITLSSNNPSVLDVPASVTVSAGAVGADVSVVTTMATGTATLTASYDGVTVTGVVHVYDDATPRRIAFAEIAPAALAVGSMATGTVRLDVPAPTGDTTITVTLPSIVTGPASVSVPAGTQEATFTLTAGAMAGSGQVSLQLGAQVVDLPVEVVEGGSRLVINEVDYDQPGSDSAEFLEIYNGTGGPVDLSNYAVVVVNGNGNTSYASYDLSGTLGAGEYFVLGNAGVTVPMGVLFQTLPSNGLQNGAPDGVALVDTSAGTVVDALSYEGSITAASVTGVSGTVNLVEGTATAVEDTGDGSLSRLPNGADTDDASADWMLGTPTPGEANVASGT